MQPTGPAYQALIDAFGKEVLSPNGEIDRKKLGQLVFANADQRARLNLLVHPHVFEVAAAQKQELLLRNKHSVVIFDAALLVETNIYREMDWVMLAYVDRATQISRLISRDGLTQEEAICRIDAQMPLDDKIPLVDEVIDNRGTRVETEDAVFRVYQRLKERG